MRWRSDLAMMPDLVAALPPGTEVLDYSTPAPAAAASCAVVAVPARNEEAVVGRCLHALADQGPVEVALLLNNCEDGTAAAAMSAAASSGLRVSVLNVRLPAEAAHAGWARRLAMDLAAGLLLKRGKPDGVILTTDADCAPSRHAPLRPAAGRSGQRHATRCSRPPTSQPPPCRPRSC